ncbi:DUF3862 domain-containing protein [Paenibacillus sp. UNC451MF]|uniref:DUF3862 domain-containing protein n=1 Tax=Paenibacillus sp. UNC451MF TaxID=1449063 RepID=UPI000A9060DE|nr:DUF3862 domain-containing protein [Paenibacillus sp. UNC451MF]
MNLKWIAMTLAVALSLVGCGGESAKQTSGQTNKTEASEKQEGNSLITKAKFEKIENGMSYEEVVKIIGGSGELLSEIGKKGEKTHTTVYVYKGEGTVGANATLTFQDGKLMAKAQAGLK